jgi:DNA-binding GntR family transcriptional regulator
MNTAAIEQESVVTSLEGARQGARGALVCDAIRSAIRNGQITSGQRLRETELANWLGVSRTPVREALKTLEAQRLVTAAGDGMVVRTLSAREVAELYTAWSELERVAARHAAMNASAADVKIMQVICEQWDARLSPVELGSINHRLHQAIYGAAHNAFLHRALDAIDDSLALLGLHTYSVAQRREQAGTEHHEIVDAIARRDPEAAAAAAARHIEHAEKIRLGLIAQEPRHSSERHSR